MEVGSDKLEVESEKLQVENKKIEAGSQKIEAGNHKLEVESEKLGIVDDISEIHNINTTQETENQSKIVNKNSEILNSNKISALSLSSIRAKRELEAQLKPLEKNVSVLPTEPFTETQMLEQWIKYANRLGEKGYKILESLLLLDDPKLEGTVIVHELPNESSKIDFEGEKHDLLGYLRGKLHNHNITIEIKINENIEIKKAFTVQEKYERLKGLNPNLELLKKTFDLDF